MDELCLVRGFSNCVLSKLDPYITIHTSGSVNINTAPLVVLLALGVPMATVDKITALRAGKDKLEGTADDTVFTDIAGISALVKASYPMGEDEIKKLDEIAARSLSVGSHNFLIAAEARLANRTRTKTTFCVYNRDTGRIVYWKE
jgi:type II secretory pathway component PulK